MYIQYYIMDISFIDSNENQFAEIDKKIHIQFKPVKRASKTFIFGLKQFLDDETIIKFCKVMKKQLGTNSEQNLVDDVCAFNGDHRKKIRESLINCMNIDPTKIIDKA